jgi:hypothetical protein
MSIKSIRRWVVVGLLSAFAGVAAAQAPNASMHDATVQKVLTAMERTPTDGHPDLYGEFNGMQRFSSGNYKAAMKYFLIGARYADKLSQLSIGLMYLNGRGVQEDRVAAFAWIAIAAERRYPSFLATRDEVWSRLNAQQREQAKALIEKLYPEYGDATAKPRLAKRLRWARESFTGSMLGFGSGWVTSLTPAQYAQSLSPGTKSASAAGQWAGPMPPCGADSIDGAAIPGCGNLYAKWRWDPKLYFKVRDSTWTGTVTVGPIRQGDAPTHSAK